MKRAIIALSFFPVLIAALAASWAIPSSAADRPHPAATVTVSLAATHQTIDGFGGSRALDVAEVTHGSTGLSPTKQRELLDVRALQ